MVQIVQCEKKGAKNARGKEQNTTVKNDNHRKTENECTRPLQDVEVDPSLEPSLSGCRGRNEYDNPSCLSNPGPYFPFTWSCLVESKSDAKGGAKHLPVWSLS